MKPFSHILLFYLELYQVYYMKTYRIHVQNGIIIFASALNSVRQNVYANYFIDRISIFLCLITFFTKEYG